jgi:hypothetical protein
MTIKKDAGLINEPNINMNTKQPSGPKTISKNLQKKLEGNEELVGTIFFPKDPSFLYKDFESQQHTTNEDMEGAGKLKNADCEQRSDFLPLNLKFEREIAPSTDRNMLNQIWNQFYQRVRVSRNNFLVQNINNVLANTPQLLNFSIKDPQQGDPNSRAQEGVYFSILGSRNVNYFHISFHPLRNPNPTMMDVDGNILTRKQEQSLVDAPRLTQDFTLSSRGSFHTRANTLNRNITQANFDISFELAWVYDSISEQYYIQIVNYIYEQTRRKPDNCLHNHLIIPIIKAINEEFKTLPINNLPNLLPTERNKYLTHHDTEELDPDGLDPKGIILNYKNKKATLEPRQSSEKESSIDIGSSEKESSEKESSIDIGSSEKESSIDIGSSEKESSIDIGSSEKKSSLNPEANESSGKMEIVGIAKESSEKESSLNPDAKEWIPSSNSIPS